MDVPFLPVGHQGAYQPKHYRQCSLNDFELFSDEDTFVEEFSSSRSAVEIELESLEGVNCDSYVNHYFEIINSPNRIDFEQDKKRVCAWKQERLNERVAKHLKPLSRHDHQVMLRILIGQAYGKDPQRKENRVKWCKVLSNMSNKFDGAAAILSMSPDPFNEVLGALSRMRLWSNTQRKWDFTFPFEFQMKEQIVLAQLRHRRSLFLN